MYSYIIGKITEVEPNSITLENNGIGYLVYTPNPYVYELGKEYKIYLYQQIKEDEHCLFGFKDIKEKLLFLKLLSVKGLGPKMTLPILATGSIDGIKDAIERENVLYLKKFPKIGDKLAKQMILDLKGKLGEVNETNILPDTKEDLSEALKALGYKEKEIKSVIVKVGNDLSLEEQIRTSLKLLLK